MFYIIINIMCLLVIEIVGNFAMLPFLEFKSAPDYFEMQIYLFWFSFDVFFALVMLSWFFCDHHDHFKLEFNKFFKGNKVI